MDAENKIVHMSMKYGDDPKLTEKILLLINNIFYHHSTKVLRSEIKNASYDILQSARYSVIHFIMGRYFEKYGKNNHLEIFSETMFDDGVNKIEGDIFIITKKQLVDLLEDVYKDAEKKNDQVLRIFKILLPKQMSKQMP